MITREADYAVRAILYLAQHHNDGPASSARLAEKMGIPYRFLRKIMRRLVTNGLVLSRRGKHGGVSLARPPHAVSLLDVLNTVDPHGAKLNLCLTDADSCSRKPNCATFTAMSKIQTLIDKHMASVTFDQLI